MDLIWQLILALVLGYLLIHFILRPSIGSPDKENVMRIIANAIRKWRDPATQRRKLQSRVDNLRRNQAWVLDHNAPINELKLALREDKDGEYIDKRQLMHVLRNYAVWSIPPHHLHWLTSPREIHLRIGRLERKWAQL